MTLEMSRARRSAAPVRPSSANARFAVTAAVMAALAALAVVFVPLALALAL